MTTSAPRYHILDALRGATLLSMIAYHTMWDLVFLFGLDGARGWYTGRPGFIWQQSICITFLGRKSLAIYIVHQPVIYGILWVINQP